MADSLYDHDFLVWSEQQADLLARLARGERVNAAVDWPHVIEEVRDLGRSDLKAVESLLARALEHLLKVAGWPSGPVEHWLSEALTFPLDARRRWTPSMRQRVDIAELYADALQPVRGITIDGVQPASLPEKYTVTSDDLIVDRPGSPEVRRLAERLLPPSLT